MGRVFMAETGYPRSGYPVSHASLRFGLWMEPSVMELFEPRRELGVVVRGSLSKGLEVKLDPTRSIEELRAGRFVVVEGQEYDYFSMITDIALGATSAEV